MSFKNLLKKLALILIIVVLSVGLIGCDNENKIKNNEQMGVKLGDSNKEVHKTIDEKILNLYSDELDYGRQIIVDYDEDYGFRFKGSISSYKNKVFAMWYLYYGEEKAPVRYEIMDKYKDFDIIIEEGDKKEDSMIKLDDEIYISDSETKAYFFVGEKESSLASRSGMSLEEYPYDEASGLEKEYEDKKYDELLRSELVKMRETIDENRISQFDEFSENALDSNKSYYSW